MTQVNIHNENVWVTREKLAQHFAFSLRTVANLQKRRVSPRSLQPKQVRAGPHKVRAPQHLPHINYEKTTENSGRWSLFVSSDTENASHFRHTLEVGAAVVAFITGTRS